MFEKLLSETFFFYFSLFFSFCVRFFVVTVVYTKEVHTHTRTSKHKYMFIKQCSSVRSAMMSYRCDFRSVNLVLLLAATAILFLLLPIWSIGVKLKIKLFLPTICAIYWYGWMDHFQCDSNYWPIERKKQHSVLWTLQFDFH